MRVRSQKKKIAQTFGDSSYTHPKFYELFFCFNLYILRPLFVSSIAHFVSLHNLYFDKKKGEWYNPSATNRFTANNKNTKKKITPAIFSTHNP